MRGVEKAVGPVFRPPLRVCSVETVKYCGQGQDTLSLELWTPNTEPGNTWLPNPAPTIDSCSSKGHALLPGSCTTITHRAMSGRGKRPRKLPQALTCRLRQCARRLPIANRIRRNSRRTGKRKRHWRQRPAATLPRPKRVVPPRKSQQKTTPGFFCDEAI